LADLTAGLTPPKNHRQDDGAIVSPKFQSGNIGYPSSAVRQITVVRLKCRATNFSSATLRQMEDRKPDSLRRIGLAIGVTLLLAVMATELALSARQQSQTFDEGVHIYAGYRYWKNFDFGSNPEHPPLVKLIATIPLLRMSLRLPPTMPNVDFKMVEYASGRDFLYGNDAKALLWRARMAAASFTIGLGLTIFLVAYAMWGAGPAFLALALLIFEPNFLAHGALVTTDVGVTLGIFLGVSSFYFYMKKPTALRLAGAGLAAGFCLGVKHSGILLFPMLLILAIAELAPFRDPATRKFAPDLAKRALRQAAALAAIAAISLVVLWSLYGFRFAARPSGLKVTPSLPEFANYMSHSSSAIVLQVAHWHLLPESYLYGIVDVFSEATIPTVIFGKYYPTAQWFYFPSVFLVKSTLAFLILCCLAPFGAALFRKQFRRELLFIILPPALYLAVAMSSRINYGVRHLLPIFPFLIILVSAAAWKLGERHQALAAFVAILVACHAASSLRAYPNYIPYANELWGGPAKTHEILADSNVDWGQGLVAMKQYIDQRKIKNCWFAYFGSLIVDVSYYGIPCKPLPTAFTDLMQFPMEIVPPQVDEPVFLSATEVTRTFWKADWVNPYAAFQRIPPAALVADSILVFDGKVDLSQASSLTHENLASQFMHEGKFDQALAEAEAAVEVAPNRPIAHATRSRILSAMGRTDEAMDEIRKADSIADTILAAQ
jgi:tetratricopeptide (TPR) repeat protein